MTKRKVIENVITHRDILGPMFCSKKVDTFAQECMEESKYTYMYRGEVEIPPLSMFDDLLSVSECGFKTSMAHAYLTFKLTVRDYNLDHKFTFTCFPFIQHCTICFLPGN